MALTPLINGVNYSAVNVNNFAFGVPVTGILAIKYSRKQVKENNYALGAEPASRGYGQVTYEGSLTVYKEWWNAVCDAAPGGDPLAIAPFDWTISYGGGTIPVRTETLKAFEFLEDGTGVSSGDTKVTLEIPFIFAGIVRS